MKNLMRGLLAVAALASTLSLSAQTADEIVAKHIAAIGGKDSISKVRSLYMETSISMMGGETPSTTTIVDGVGYRSETEVNGTKVINCFNDKGGWIVNPMAGVTDPTPMSTDVYNAGKGQINVGGELYDYAAKGSKIELLDKDGNNYKIKLTTKENVSTTYLIDSTTYYLSSVLSKGKMQDQDVDITTKLSDFRKTELGFVIPYTIDIDFGQFALSIAVKKVELNKTIDPTIFVMPKPAAAPTATK